MRFISILFVFLFAVCGCQRQKPTCSVPRIYDPNADVVVYPQIIDLHNGYDQFHCPKGYTLHGEDFLCHTHVWDDGLSR